MTPEQWTILFQVLSSIGAAAAALAAYLKTRTAEAKLDENTQETRKAAKHAEDAANHTAERTANETALINQIVALQTETYRLKRLLEAVGLTPEGQTALTKARAMLHSTRVVRRVPPPAAPVPPLNPQILPPDPVDEDLDDPTGFDSGRVLPE